MFDNLDSSQQVLILFGFVLAIMVISFLFLKKEGLDDSSSNDAMNMSSLLMPSEVNQGLLESDKQTTMNVVKSNLDRSNNTLNASELLPDPAKSKDYFDTDFDTASLKVSRDDLINVDRYVGVGVDTIGQTLKNAAYDIRGNIFVPKNYTLTPWMNSTIEPDTNFKGL